MRIGVFGGTFDPPHIGHLIAAADACELLNLDRIVLIPAATQPFKAGIPSASAAHRLQMVRLLAQSDPRFEVESLEVERGGLSFTIDTLQVLRQRWPAGKAELVLVLGADAAAQFPRWKDPGGVQALAEVVVMTRGAGQEQIPAGVRVAASRRVDVSSSEIRERVRAGKPVRALLTEAVATYIATHGLYR